jgi:hypothetical protein
MTEKSLKKKYFDIFRKSELKLKEFKISVEEREVLSVDDKFYLLNLKGKNFQIVFKHNPQSNEVSVYNAKGSMNYKNKKTIIFAIIETIEEKFPNSSVTFSDLIIKDKKLWADINLNMTIEENTERVSGFGTTKKEEE